MMKQRRRATPVGQRTLKDWTPKKAHSFAMKRVQEIELLLQEISYTYDQIFQPVAYECDQLIENGLKVLRDEISNALEIEAQL